MALVVMGFTTSDKSQASILRSSYALRCLTVVLAAITFLSGLPTANAQNPVYPDGWSPQQCIIVSDSSNSTGVQYLNILDWAKRGDCIRNGSEPKCLATLQFALASLSSLRSAEYSASAGLLSLLPTIGALLGSPSNEIWKLMAMVPFGGGLAILLSFGGAILPVKLEDYEDVGYNTDMAIGSVVSLTRSIKRDQPTPHSTERKLSLVVERVRQRLSRKESARIPKWHLWSGLFAMLAFLAAAQIVMGIAEQGGVVVFWCSWRWWMHFWYISVIVTAMLENWAQAPFIKTYKLYVSNVPYDVSTSGGESVIECFEGEATDNIAIALQQLNTLKVARLTFHGSPAYTRARNSVLVLVSVVGDTSWKKFFRVISKALSIYAFVTGTGIFASTTLLAFVPAVLVLTLTLAAGVLGRGIATWVVSRVSDVEPVIHVIVSNRQEAHKVIAEILTINSEDGNSFQTEIKGHIILNRRRVGKRSRLWVAILGVVAEPYDLRKVQQSTWSSADMASPFLGTELGPVSTRDVEKASGVRVHAADIGGVSDLESLTGEVRRISRKPIGSSSHGSSSC